MKDKYKQIFIDEMRKYDDEMSIVEDRNPEADVVRISTSLSLMKRNLPEIL